MEKMFVYPESLDSKNVHRTTLEEVENRRSSADIASHRCKLYRTLLEQRMASEQTRPLRIDHERSTDGVHA